MSPQAALALDVLIISLALSPVVWRITRFLLLDSLIDEPRELLRNWLSQGITTRRFGAVAYYLRSKLIILMECAFCVSIWVSAGVVLGWCAIAWSWIGWMFIPVWLSGSTGCMIIYRYVDPPDPCLPSKTCGE